MRPGWRWASLTLKKSQARARSVESRCVDGQLQWGQKRLPTGESCLNPAEGGDPKALKRLRRVFPGLRASLSRPGPVKAPGRDQGSKTPSERHRVNLVTHPLALGPGNRSPAWLCPKPPSALPAHGSPFRAGRGLVAGVQPEQNRQNTGGPSPDLLWLREPLRTLFQRPREQPAPTLGGAGASPQPFPSRPAPWTRDRWGPGGGGGGADQQLSGRRPIMRACRAGTAGAGTEGQG